MQRRHHLLPSRHMDRGIHVWQYGHWGPPLLVFPTAAGMAHEWEAQGMVGEVADLVEAGRVKLYCVESNVAEAWTRQEAPADWRVGRHIAYEHFVLEELVPWMRWDCRAQELPIALAGCSLGALYAANFALKYPHLFPWALCLSGRYEVTGFTGGYSNADIYYNNPLAYVANLHGEALERIRRGTHLVLVCGQGKWEEGCIEETRALGGLCAAKGISHELDLWGHDVSHDWAWWRRQFRHHLRRSLG